MLLEREFNSLTTSGEYVSPWGEKWLKSHVVPGPGLQILMYIELGILALGSHLQDGGASLQSPMNLILLGACQEI